jgi:hypothetical protein
MKVEFPAPRFFAATDFARIALHIPMSEVSLDFVGDLRGLAYHEAGHVRKSVPLTDLLGAMLPDEDEDGDNALAFIQNVWGLDEKAFQRAWNVLEDQRMETAMVADSPNLANYYNVIVLSHVMHEDILDTAWLWLIGREHVDDDVCAAAREGMIQAHGEALVLQAEALVDAYMAATTPEELWACIIPYGLLMQQVGCTGGAVDQHDSQPGGDGGSGAFDDDDLFDEDGNPSEALHKALDELADRILDGATQRPSKADKGAGDDDAWPSPDDGAGDKHAVPGAPDEPSKSDNKDGEGTDPSKAETPSSGSGLGEGDPDLMKRLVNEALQRAIERRNADKNLAHDVRSFNEAFRDARSATPLRRLMPQRASDPGRMSQAVQANRALRVLFEQARAEQAPTWQVGQTRGVLDVVRYKTRRPGDREFFRDYADNGDLRLPNLAVSLLLDGSGSMRSPHNFDPDLGMAAYTVKSACDIFEIPCTVSVYDTDAWLLWDADDRATDMPVNFIPGGGTQPSKALSLIDHQTHGKDHHLVVIMTDGGWQDWMGGGKHDLGEYRMPGRDIVVLFWNTDERAINGLSTTAAHGRIDSLMDIPAIVRPFILAAL